MQTDTRQAADINDLFLAPQLKWLIGLAFVAGAIGLLLTIYWGASAAAELQTPVGQALFMGSLIMSGVCLLVGALTYRVLIARLQQPLQQLVAAVRQMTITNTALPLVAASRNDIIGDLARAIELVRHHFSSQADMTLPGPDGQPLAVHFYGPSRDAFGNLCQTLSGAMQSFQVQHEAQLRQLAALQEQNQDLNHQLHQRLEQLANQSSHQQSEHQQAIVQLVHGQQQMQANQHHHVEKLQQLWPKLALLLQQQMGMVAEQQKRMENIMSQLAASPTLLHQTERELRQVASTYQQQATDLTDQLQAATSVMRASGRLLAETHDMARTQLADATRQMLATEGMVGGFVSDATQKLQGIMELTESLAKLCLRADAQLNQLAAGQQQLSAGQQKFADILAEAQPVQPQLMARTVGAILGQLKDLSAQMQQLTTKLPQLQQSSALQSTLLRMQELRDQLADGQALDDNVRQG